MAFTAGPAVARGLVLQRHRDACRRRGADGVWRIHADVTREREPGSGPTEGEAWEDAADEAIAAAMLGAVGGTGPA